MLCRPSLPSRILSSQRSESSLESWLRWRMPSAKVEGLPLPQQAPGDAQSSQQVAAMLRTLLQVRVPSAVGLLV